MKVITLNTWGGRGGKVGILSFFQKYRDDIDIFCLQEIWAAPYKNLEGYLAGGREIKQSEIMTYGKQEISAILPDHHSFFRPHYLDSFGLLSLVKKDLNIKEEGEFFVHKHKGYEPKGDIGNHARNLQYTKITLGGKIINIVNFHGLWNGKGKSDCDERLIQSNKIAEFIRNINGEIVFCGDFNLSPDTESLKILENLGLRNLIKEFNITSTRTSHYTKPEKYADYILVSKNVNVKDFKVLPEEVSDHSPLFLDIS